MIRKSVCVVMLSYSLILGSENTSFEVMDHTIKCRGARIDATQLMLKNNFNAAEDVLKQSFDHIVTLFDLRQTCELLYQLENPNLALALLKTKTDVCNCFIPELEKVIKLLEQHHADATALITHYKAVLAEKRLSLSSL
jgi:hypothetical protein